jgi:hypothetical protein
MRMNASAVSWYVVVTGGIVAAFGRRRQRVPRT